YRGRRVYRDGGDDGTLPQAALPWWGSKEIPVAIVPNNHTYFFIHIMKTGGTSFIGRCRQNFYPHEILGGEDEDKPWLSDPSQFLDARRMKEIVAARRFRLRLLYGHVPPAAAPAV